MIGIVSHVRIGFLLCSIVLAATPAALAQTLGTFRWQLQPFCNVVTLAATQRAGAFQLEGADDQCGDAVVAPVMGTAILNPNGSIGLGLVIISAPGGIPLHLDATIDLATISGEWYDSVGRRGSFVLTPGASAGGQRRPDVAAALNGVTLGFGLTTGPAGDPVLQVDLPQVRAGLQIQESGSNLALGAEAMLFPNQGAGNVAVGRRALRSLTLGALNTAVGTDALVQLTEGTDNIAFGVVALGGVKTGRFNIGVGGATLASNAAGDGNVAIGSSALNRATGNNNIAIGVNAGALLQGGSNNIYIANDGLAADENLIRIGNGSHVGAVITGIAGRTSSGGVGVFVNNDGRLGTLTSSARFKHAIQPIAGVREKLHALRPVQFVYKPEYDDGSSQLQYGLIAEEVAATFPELVVRDERGEPSTVRYQLLTPLLLDEVQQLYAEIAVLEKAVAALRANPR